MVSRPTRFTVWVPSNPGCQVWPHVGLRDFFEPRALVSWRVDGDAMIVRPHTRVVKIDVQNEDRSLLLA